MSEVKHMKNIKWMRSLTAAATALFLAGVTAPHVQAQNLFAPVARVDAQAITEFEVQQRMRFLQLLNAPGASRKAALDALIEDRLRTAELSRFDIALSEEELAAGLAEFAARANLSTEEFVTALAQAGVDRETFRDFISISITWRNYIRARFDPRVNLSDAEVDRELAATVSNDGIRLLLSEIIIPAPPQQAARVAALADQISQSTSAAEFSSFARRFSATASRGNGGRLPWQDIDDLPPTLQPLLLALAVGEVTQPLPIPNAVALFQLRGIEETGKPRRNYSQIEYAAYYIAGGRSEPALAEASRIRASVDNCNDLYAVAQGQPEDVLERGSKAPGEIPQDIAIELSKLDPGESSVALTRANGQTLVFLMLCKRVAEGNADADREQVAQSIRQRKLQGFSQQLIEQLRADARIIRY